MAMAKQTFREDRLALGLGWFSIGLGIASVLAPRAVGKLIGVKGCTGLIRLVGFRELASGIGILSRKPGTWVKARVGGDAIDLALLGSAFTRRGTERNRLAAATAAVAGVTALDILSSRQLSRSPDGGQAQIHGTHVIKAITINKSAEELYGFWRNFENLPRFMWNLQSVAITGERRSHWITKGPAGTKVEWDAETTEDVPNQRIAWRSVEGSQVQHSGQVTFQQLPGDRGTIVRSEIYYLTPGGTLGKLFAKVFGSSPEQQIMEDLRRFKQLLETGEIPTTQGQPAGRKSSISKKFDVAARSMAEAT